MDFANIKMTLCYDGSRFFGWQKTKARPSIEETLEKALLPFLKEKILLQAASRTDRGVHATCQVVNFFTRQNLDLPLLQRSLNALLPKTIAIKSLEKVPLSFHPTLDATGKEYHYFICNTPIQSPFVRTTSWHIPTPLDVAKMEEAIPPLLGLNDFSSFCNQRKNLVYPHKVRHIWDINIETLDERRLKIVVRGEDFLYKMVRIIVGTLIDVGLKKISPSNISSILETKQRAFAGVTAPAHGLFLANIFYPEEIKTVVYSEGKNMVLI